MTTALLLIDLQLGMFDGKAMPPIHDGAGLLDRVGRLLAAARRAGVRVVHVRHDGGPGGMLAYGAEGWQIHPLLAPGPDEPVIDKRTPDGFHETLLSEALAGTTRLVVAGAQTEFCVDTTCRRGSSLGYAITLVADGHSTWDNGVLTAAQIIAHANQTLAGGFVRTALAAEAL